METKCDSRSNTYIPPWETTVFVLQEKYYYTAPFGYTVRGDERAP